MGCLFDYYYDDDNNNNNNNPMSFLLKIEFQTILKCYNDSLVPYVVIK
jgi:hypothetical protein